MGRDPTGVDTYSVRLFADFAWKAIVVSADTPYNAATMTSETDPAIWGLMYEKALAVVAGGYADLYGINTTDVIETLTGRAATQNPGGGQGALNDLNLELPVTSEGVAGGEGYYDVSSGDRLADGSGGAVYIHDRHYYAAAGYVNAAHQAVVVFNPWNAGAGENGRFVVSAAAYAKIYWGYNYVSTQ